MDPIDADLEKGAAYPRIPGFACKHCHRVRYFSRVSKHTWGEIVCYLSAGLLYGHEVQRPSWLKPQRKHKYSPHLNREPSKRRPQIEQLLLAGLTIDQAAARIGLAKGTVLFYTKSIYRQYGVRSLRELYLKKGLPLRPGMRGPGLGKRGDGRFPRLRKRAPTPAPTPTPL